MKTNRLFGLLLLVMTACQGGDVSEEAASAAAVPTEVRFVATDFAFEGPSTIEAGMITFALENNGQTLHHLQLVKLPEGMTFQAFQEALGQMQPGTPPPAWFADVGGVNPPAPGQAARTTLMVEAGEYAVLCIVDAPDHVPHVFKGMIQPLTVTPSATPAAPMPAADLNLSLVDYAFSFSTPPTAGPKVIHVTNGAAQSHEVAFIKLHPGRTMDDVNAWAATYAGEPPFDMQGGVPGIRPGQTVAVQVDFTPGEWAALCFVPDATDGVPHVVHGMVLPFTVS